MLLAALVRWVAGLTLPATTFTKELPLCEELTDWAFRLTERSCRKHGSSLARSSGGVGSDPRWPQPWPNHCALGLAASDSHSGISDPTTWLPHE